MRSIPFLIFFLLLLSLGGCSGDDAPRSPAVAQTGEASSNLSKPGVTTNTSSEMTFVLKRHRRIEEMEKLGMLRCDSLGYDCAYDPGGGSFRLCYLDDELVRATHDYSRGDHGGGSETYYYDGGELFLADLSSSSWGFTDALQESENGMMVPVTEEDVHEEKRYFYNGNMVDRTYRDYKIRSGSDAPDPGTIPDQQSGIGVDDGIGSEVMLQVARRGKYECE